MQKEEIIFIRHLADLSRQAGYKYIKTYSDFLNLNELSLLHNHSSELRDSRFSIYGGYPSAERCMVCFHPEDTPAADYPIQCLRIEPLMAKFSDRLTHRDFLGAVLNLGIERGRIGDILVKENTGWMFCHADFSEFIMANLSTIKHTRIRISCTDSADIDISPEFKLKQGTVSSIRLDSVIALAFSLSRSKAAVFISQGVVFVNGRLAESNSYALKNGDIVSVRKQGRFRLELTDKKSKKDKLVVKAHLFI